MLENIKEKGENWNSKSTWADETKTEKDRWKPQEIK